MTRVVAAGFEPGVGPKIYQSPEGEQTCRRSSRDPLRSDLVTEKRCHLIGPGGTLAAHHQARSGIAALDRPSELTREIEMSQSTTLIGNLTSDPELRVTPSGTSVCNFSVAQNYRRYDKAKGEWVDGDVLFVRCTIWQEPAENIAERLRKGDRVIVVGRMISRQWEHEGQTRYSTEMQVEEVGASARYALLTIQKPARKSDAERDPWASKGPQDSDAPPVDDEPPF